MFGDAQFDALYRYGLSLTNDEALSYDLLQDALEGFLKLDVARRPVDGAEFYLRKAMRNRYIDQLRKEERYPHESREDGGDRLISMAMPDPGELVIDRRMVASILERLNPMERELLHLWAYEEFTAKEIGSSTWDRLESGKALAYETPTRQGPSGPPEQQAARCPAVHATGPR